MKPIDSLPTGAQRQGTAPGRKKTGQKQQFLLINTSKKANTAMPNAGQQPGEQIAQTNNTIASSAPANRAPATSNPPPKAAVRAPGKPAFTLGDLRKGELSRIDTHKTGALAPPHNQIEDAPTVELAPVKPPPSPMPTRPQGPRITRPLYPNSGEQTAQIPMPGAAQGPRITRPLYPNSSKQIAQIPMPGVTQAPVGMAGMMPMSTPSIAPMSMPGLPVRQQQSPAIPTPPWAQQAGNTTPITRGKVALLIALLCVVVIQGLTLGPKQFLGSEGWAVVLGTGQQNNSLLSNLPTTQPKGTAQATTTPQQYIDTIISRMSLDQKLGQMIMVQFLGPDATLELETMLTQYHAGAVLLFEGDGNITADGERLKALTREIQAKSTLPAIIATDQEGGDVDRMKQLSGRSPSAEDIGATHDPNKAREVGQNDAEHLSTYGINLNLAPVVDVNTLDSSTVSSEGRTYSTDPAVVAQMAEAYLEGLQESGKVLGTLKHFPGLGGVIGDPHSQLTYLQGDRNRLDSVEWAPYHTLIQQGKVHAIMVTHTYVTSIDPNYPASLSPKVQAVLRNDMGFQGVIITDSLKMAGVNFLPGEAAALAVKAGSDMIMGASNPDIMVQMINGIKQSISAGEITEQRINESVKRILLMKYADGLLPLPQQ